MLPCKYHIELQILSQETPHRRYTVLVSIRERRKRFEKRIRISAHT